MFCHNCGKPNKENANFCEFCGTKLLKVSSEQNDGEASEKDASEHQQTQNTEKSDIEKLDSKEHFQEKARTPEEMENELKVSSEPKEQEPIITPLMPDSNQQSADQIPIQNSEEKRDQPKRKQGILIALISISALLLLIAVFFLGSRFTSNSDDLSTNSSSYQKVAESKTSSDKEISLDLQISQIDNSLFPEMAIYTRIQDIEGGNLSEINKEYFSISEVDANGRIYETTIDEIIPVSKSNEMNINLVIDQSGSMDDDDKMTNAKTAAARFLDEILKSNKNTVEITSFDDYVYNIQPFTSNGADLRKAIHSIQTNGQTAMYDAIYDALIQTNQKKGSRFVIAFTDGQENASLHSEDEVVELSRLTGIPVYIIGIGSQTDYSGISDLAVRCNGDYYNANVVNLSNLLLDIYDEVYQVQRNLYKITYTSSSKDNLKSYRTVELSAGKRSHFVGSTKLDYMPKDSIAEIDNAKLLSIIESRTSAENIAVAIVDLETNLEYRVGNARKSYVASGFYAPVYIVAASRNQSQADIMMSKMDNDAGNVLINAFGGLSSINHALSQKGYTQTTFSREFGDVAASDHGYENYTSAVDSAKILKDIYLNDGYKKMNWDLSKDGISVPVDATIYAHRGQGIGAAYNVFAIIESAEVSYGLAIMTAHTGSNDEEVKAVAIPMISQIIQEVHKEMAGK